MNNSGTDKPDDVAAAIVSESVMVAPRATDNFDALNAKYAEEYKADNQIRTRWISQVQIELIERGFKDDFALVLAQRRWNANQNVIIPRLAAINLMKAIERVAP